MVKTRRNPADSKRQKAPLDPIASEQILQEANELLTRCQAVAEFGSPVISPDTFEIATSSFDVCPICSNTFDYSAREPICLPCGHTICRECTARIRQSPARGSCPFDRKEFFTVIDSLPVNFAILAMIDTRTRITKLLCKKHKKELIGFSPESEELLCGVCLFEKKGQVCCQFSSETARLRSEEKKTLVEGFLKTLGTQREIWAHCLSMTELCLDSLKSLEETSETKPLSHMSIGLSQVFTQICDRKKECEAELQGLIDTWETLSFPDRLCKKVNVSDDIDLATACMKLMTALLKISR